MRNNKLKIAIAAALALSAASVSAADIALSGGGTKNVSTVSAAANLKALGSTADQVGTLLAGVDNLEVGDVITITATNCKFDRDALGADPVSIAGGGEEGIWTLDATNTILTATITTQSTDASDDTLTLVGKYDLTGVASSVVPAVDMTVTRSVLGVDTVIHKKASSTDALQVFNVTDKLQDLATVTAVDGVLNVADSFKKIDGTLVHTIPNGNVDTAGHLDSNAASATGTSLFTLTGLPVSATKVEWGTTTGAFSQVTSDGSTAPTTATTGSDFYLDGAGNGYALLNNTGAKAVFNDSADLVITVDGESAIPTTKVKLAVDYKAGVADVFSSHTILSATTVAALTRDGSSFTVNSTGPLNMIKITDTSSALITGTGAIGVTAFDAAGAEVSGSITIPSLTSNSTVIVSGSDLVAAFPGAIRFDFTVESSAIVASNVKKSSTGTSISNYSTTGKTL
jgi:hypothetical protein